MSPKWRYTFGAVTIGIIVGGTAYAIYKSAQAKRNEEDAITLSEAREIVQEREGVEGVSNTDDYLDVGRQVSEGLAKGLESDIGIVKNTEDRQIAQAVSMAEYKRIQEEEDDEQEAMDELDDDDYPGVDERIPEPTVEPLSDFSYYEEGIDPKGDTELRHDPNSVEAKHQFIRMELADWEPTDATYRIMLQLFEFVFIPNNDGDEILRTQIIDYKVQFFGFGSRWNREVSYADIFFHYARAAEFNCGESVSYWVDYFLNFNEFEWDSTSNELDTLIMRLNSHTYFNEERQTFGLFGLSREGMDQAIRIASRNVDRSVTYEIEFNEFLKSCL